ncbi:type II toxin-antitoxin system death-on-curing family toxin [Rhodobacter sp. NSM]|uniref:type II toxin-antitoxin system death-on-curing family toxin n=1 Tax=Rhodobacter sp. NSM TaxID=3457501 RepID=UPI003FCFC8C0
MTEPRWLDREAVEAIHETMIDIGGGSHGLRDAALLESALARPQNLYAYGEQDTFQLAASYAEGIARNHPFVDGNKRTAFASADLFLVESGYNLEKAKAFEHAEMMEKLGQGHITRAEAAEYLKANVLSKKEDRQKAGEKFEEKSRKDKWARLEELGKQADLDKGMSKDLSRKR